MSRSKLLTLSLLSASLAISGCSFFHNLSDYSDSSFIPISENPDEKRTLRYTINDLANHSMYDIDAMPSKGNPKLLVIPIWFTDSNYFITTFEKNKILSDINVAMFGTNEATGWYSAKSYYEAESYGSCSISGTVTPWYECGKNYNYFDSSKKSTELAEEAVSYWKSNNPGQASEYDSDGDGFIDGVLILYGGPNYTNTEALKGRATNSHMWAHTSWSDKSANKNDPNVKTFIWASYDFMYINAKHGIRVDSHTYTHEMGHVFGLDDYYDYNSKGSWSGYYSMQDHNIGGHDPFSMMALGWASPYVPNDTSTYSIGPFVSTGDIVLLSSTYNGSPFDEYLLFELYVPSLTNEHDVKYRYGSYEKGPNQAGIRVWHVDSRLIYSRGGSYEKTTEINNKSYCIGPTNTTPGGDYDEYCSKDQTLRKFKNLELIRRNDFSHTRPSSEDPSLVAGDLFVTGDSFSISSYVSYFKNSFGSNARMNNGSSLNWTVTFDTVTSEGATITLTKNEA